MDSTGHFETRTLSEDDGEGGPVGSDGDDIGRLIFEVCVSFCLISGLILNGTLIFVFAKRRGFRAQISNRFMISLVFSNLFMVFLLIPLLLTDNIPSSKFSNHHNFDYPPDIQTTPAYHAFFCSAVEAILVTSATSSLLSQVLIAADQYLAVVYPLHYHRYINSPRCIILCISVWITSFGLGLGKIIDSALVIPKDEEGFVLVHGCHYPEHISIPYGVIYFSLSFFLPIVVLTFVYARIYMAAKKNMRRTRGADCSSRRKGSNSSTNFESLNPLGYQSTVTTTSSGRNSNSSGRSNGGRTRTTSKSCSDAFSPDYVPSVPSTNLMEDDNFPLAEYQRHCKETGQSSHSFPCANLKASRGASVYLVIKRKLSQAGSLISIFKGETRAARLTVYVMFSVVACWTPHFCLLLFNLITHHEVIEARHHHSRLPELVALFLASISVVISPLCYGFRSRQVRREVERAFKMLSCHCFWSSTGKKQRKMAAIIGKSSNGIVRNKSFSCPQLLLNNNEASTIIKGKNPALEHNNMDSLSSSEYKKGHKREESASSVNSEATKPATTPETMSDKDSRDIAL